MAVHQLVGLRMTSHVLSHLERVFVECVEMADLMRLRNVTMETMMMETVVTLLVMLRSTSNVKVRLENKVFVMESVEIIN